MTSRTFLLCSMLFITNASHSMKIVKKEDTNILKKIFETKPLFLAGHLGCYHGYYLLSSPKDYKIFLTLPIESRQCLIDAPQPNKTYLYQKMNGECAVAVVQKSTIWSHTPSYMGTVIKLKSIIPEHKDKNMHCLRILLRQDGRYYCP